MTRKKILAISGSTRRKSTSETILKLIASMHEELDVNIYNGIEALPYFNPDHDNENVNSNVKELRDLIDQADGVILCTPEYVFSLPGVLKNAIEWTVSTTVFSDKAVALIIASGLGEKAYESLILIMSTVGAKIATDSTLLISGARSKFNHTGEITDELTSQAIKKLTASLIESINSNKAIREETGTVKNL